MVFREADEPAFYHDQLQSASDCLSHATYPATVRGSRCGQRRADPYAAAFIRGRSPLGLEGRIAPGTDGAAT